MEIKNKRIVVTGAASGIGLALCEEFYASGAQSIVCVDMNEDGVPEYGYNGTGYGQLGNQTKFSDDSTIFYSSNPAGNWAGPEFILPQAKQSRSQCAQSASVRKARLNMFYATCVPLRLRLLKRGLMYPAHRFGQERPEK